MDQTIGGNEMIFGACGVCRRHFFVYFSQLIFHQRSRFCGILFAKQKESKKPLQMCKKGLTYAGLSCIINVK